MIVLDEGGGIISIKATEGHKIKSYCTARLIGIVPMSTTWRGSFSVGRNAIVSEDSLGCGCVATGLGGRPDDAVSRGLAPSSHQGSQHSPFDKEVDYMAVVEGVVPDADLPSRGELPAAMGGVQPELLSSNGNFGSVLQGYGSGSEPGHVQEDLLDLVQA